ncbi:MAG: acyl-CoA synthetase [Candidatus Dactylopiibacterium carminicum]|uniref:Acyl-CoA synthetase n=1 Tax=Candidatus Dactylopiibacterium carminicum TaxID=857335 RepID=A0A272EWU3_9RHOO|nr:acyl-CoA synthetase [Candidatus Dactylopiibacterium carminicum]KAF7600035.1 acyl-CoA synthetase [Candidatus Dactylopiibacterium carminicum]PAS94575.1 MAG: acyl-CoA synthetase [Candidatus Dactylopiibacterium carminicum]PAS97614.1 MAG: acyl-CoA synthetase [Candidatus Dactylopiibacterium carminicum]PAT00039.1 MAG: acyl-CoA synthetase [Candidatus Dactylopiibacterium carminicum]
MSGENGPPAWMQHQERGSLFWLRVMVWLSLRLGRRLTRPVVYFIALYFLLTARTARRASRTYLGRALGRPARGFELYRHVLCFAGSIHDRLYLLNGRTRALRLRHAGTAALHAAHAQGGVLLFGAHFGSFEALRALGRENLPGQVSLLMYPDNARQINATLAAINPQAMADIIPLGQLDTMLEVSHRLEQGGLISVLADRASGQDRHLTLPFLGAPAQFPTGPFRMAAMLRRPVFFMAGIHEGGNRYAVHFEPLADFSQVTRATREAAIEAALHAYVATLERHCRANPWNWFNFFDFWESSPDASA